MLVDALAFVVEYLFAVGFRKKLVEGNLDQLAYGRTGLLPLAPVDNQLLLLQPRQELLCPLQAADLLLGGLEELCQKRDSRPSAFTPAPLRKRRSRRELPGRSR
jgi:hypothetical protein